MNQQKKYAELFAAEARDHLAAIGRALVALESDPTDGAQQLDAIFRSVHTIKGMAGAMGYDVAAKLAHNIESALAELRADRRQVEPGIIDLLLQSSDALERVIDASLNEGELPDPSVIIERLVVWRMNAEPEGEANASMTGDANTVPNARRKGAVAQAESRPTGRSLRGDTSRVRVDIRRLDSLMDLVGELSVAGKRLRSLSLRSGSEELNDAIERASTLIRALQDQVIESRLVPVWQVFDRFPRLVRDAARVAEKEVELQVVGNELELDRSLLDAIGDPLVHLLRNAVDHGIEAPAERERAGKPPVGRVELSARREKARVVIEVGDDGRGIDRDSVLARAREQGLLQAEKEASPKELFRILARPGFTTAAEVTELSGRGVGLNVVDDVVRGLGGSVELRTEDGAGTSVRLELPLTLAILHALVVKVGGQIYAVPATFARESFEAEENAIERSQGREWICWRDERVPLTRLQALFADSDGNGAGQPARNPEPLNFVALEFGGSRLAVTVDDLIGEEEIVVKPFDPPAGALPVFSGATVRPDGRPALVLDVGGLS